MIAKIIVDINTRAVDKEFDYIIPDDMIPFLHIGDMVEFPFGKYNKIKTGYVIDIINNIDTDYELKSLISIKDNSVNIGKRTIEVARFIHENYGTTLIQALKAVIPVKKIVKKRTKNSDSDFNSITNDKNFVLAHEQKNIIDSVSNDIEKEKVNKYLIHGVTGSGKTQVFIELAKKISKSGKKIIILIPEISLTYQMVNRFITEFGKKVGVIHSKLSKGEKYEQIEKAKNGEIDIIIGPRSALFTPFENIGLIIIDEEHEASYKSDYSPKYDSREVAEFMSDRFNIPLILASATPSIETYYKCITGEYILFKMQERRGVAKLPNIEIIDMREEILDGNFGIFSQKLINEINRSLNNNEQVILFINRRGYANYINCLSCGTPLQCNHCDVTYTYHKEENLLKCHYCGKSIKPPNKCPICGSVHLDRVGYGTQRVEQELKKLFPDYTTIRMDQDTTSRKKSYEEIIKKFHNHEADILVGTQMIIKGHDFPAVGLVGILNVDNILNLSSYKASERTFQAIVQASGRAGRKDIRGTACIQTYQPNQYAIKFAANNDYENFYNTEIEYRKLMNYPPIKSFLKITITSYDNKKLGILTQRLWNYIDRLKKEDMSILGPSNEIIYKINDNYRKSIHIKGSTKVIKYFIRVCEYLLKKDELFNEVKISYEINAE